MTSPTTLEVRTKNGIKFGKELRDKEFMFGKGFLNLNHGSFGAYPRAVRTEMRRMQDACEARPDPFIRYDYPRLIDDSREAMAKLLKTPSQTLVFVANATTAINIVLRNLTFAPGDHILCFSTIYGACEKTIEYITETTPASSAKIPVTYPVEDDWVVDAFKAKVKEVEAKGGKVKVAVFDTIVSMPGVRVPFERLIATCKELGVLSCVDGAHGVGHLELNLGELDPDFLVSNCHKWLHTLRGTAIFYVPIRNQHLIRSTLPTSHGFEPRNSTIGSPFPKNSLDGTNKTPWTAMFDFVGSVDTSVYPCVPAALKWRESIGGEAVIRNYCQTLAQAAGKLAVEVLGTEVLENSTGSLGQCGMTNFRLPIDVAKAKALAAQAGIEEADVGSTVRDWMGKKSIDEYATFLQTFYFGGAWWGRLSGQVYLDMQDMQQGVEMLKKICERVNAGEWVGKKSKL